MRIQSLPGGLFHVLLRLDLIDTDIDAFRQAVISPWRPQHLVADRQEHAGEAGRLSTSWRYKRDAPWPGDWANATVAWQPAGDAVTAQADATLGTAYEEAAELVRAALRWARTPAASDPFAAFTVTFSGDGGGIGPAHPLGLQEASLLMEASTVRFDPAWETSRWPHAHMPFRILDQGDGAVVLARV